MLLTLYDRYNQRKVDFSPNDSSQQEKEIQSDNVLTLSFTHYECIEVDVNDYIDFMGERYWALEKYHPNEKNSQEWSYDLKLYGIESLIKRYLVLNTVDGGADPIFSYTAPPTEHVRMIVDVINREMGSTDWRVGTVEGVDNVTIDYEGKYCHEGLDELAKIVGTEYWIEGTTVNLCRCEHGEEITIGYGNGLTNISVDKANNAKFYTRLFPVGSSRNIDPQRYGYPRLQLPNGQQYVDINVEKYGVIHHYEKDAFTDIYPRRIGTVTSVRKETKTGEDGNPFDIFFIKDNALPFNPDDYMLPDKVIRISFQEGSELAGLGSEDDGSYYFEANYHSDTQEFEIITIWPYDNGDQLPNDVLVPAVGDRYILWNLRMPDEYYSLAEQEYLDAVNAYNADHALDVTKFSGQTDHTWIEEGNISLTIGQRIRLESSQYFPTAGYKSSRITRICRKVNLPSLMDIEICDALSTGTKDKLNNDISDVRNYVKSIKSSVSIPDIIRTGDNTRPTDNNLFSAKRSLREFLSALEDDTAKGHITFKKGLTAEDEVLFEKLIHIGKYLRGETQSGAAITEDGLGDFIDLRVVRRVLGSLTVENVAHAASMVFSRILKSEGAISGFIGGKGVYIDALKGLIQADGLEVRGFMRIMELIINQLQLMRSDYSFTEGGVVEHVEPAGNGYYVLTMRKEHDNDMTPFCEGDIIYGIVNNLLDKKVSVNGETPDYFRTWMRVLEDGVDQENNTLTVMFYDGLEVQGHHNFTPAGTEVYDGWTPESEGYDLTLNVTRHGNWLYDVVEGVRTARYPDRQSAWVLSTTDKRITFFWNVDKPIIEEYNYALCLGILPDLSNLPSTRDRRMPSLYVNTVFFEHKHQIHYTTPPEYRVVNMGSWYDGMVARNGLVEYGDGTSAYITWEVSHIGLQWLCATDGTTTEPHWRNPAWQCISGAEPELRLSATKRMLRNRDFANGRVGTTLGFALLLGGVNVTSDVLRAEAVWTRISIGADQDATLRALDEAWNQRHASGDLTLDITSNDLPTNWLTAKGVSFMCTVSVAGLPSRNRTFYLHA